MAKNLVIVESPAKAKTIKKYLGRDYEVIASMGHVRDLPKSRLGIDVEHDFAPHYLNIRSQSEVIKKLKAAAKDKKNIYLATDPDREGEAISWHLANLLEVPLDKPCRVTFHEITKSGVVSGMEKRRTIDMDLVDAQQARRVLDRIVGYKLSPFLWKKVKGGLSAGRVQSVAVRLIVDRDEEINAFVPEEYWSIEAELRSEHEEKSFVAKYYGKGEKKLELKTKEEADAVLAELQEAKYTVTGVKKGVRKKSPAPPFTTSTLQQEASLRLGFQAKRTMKVAQELYEGVEVEGIGAAGLITYMRTDSLRISEEAQAEAAAYVLEKYGKQYLPNQPRQYKTKGAAQDAHEAIRPSMPGLTPDQVKGSLTSEQYKLYRLIWERFIASQMAVALVDTVSVQIDASGHTFKASGNSVRFQGFMAVYVATQDKEEKENYVLLNLNEGENLQLIELGGSQHFTQPPPYYTEASLIKALEENGIGRPSTYAPTITTILGRNYVVREAKQLKPTELGTVTTGLMKEHFQQIVDVDFTASMEKEFDTVAEGKLPWVDVMHRFYGDFAVSLERAETETEGVSFKVPDEETDIVCEKCGRNMVIKNGRFGRFLACPGYPECKNTKRLTKEMPGSCPICGKKILEKKSKRGKVFYGCENNPACAFLSWDPPTAHVCPKCGKTLMQKGKRGTLYCVTEGCGFERKAEEA